MWFDAYKNGDRDEAKAQILQFPEILLDPGDWTAYLIALEGDIATLEHMLSVVQSTRLNVKDVFSKANSDGDTPAHGAAYSDSIECLSFLLHHCGNKTLEARDNEGVTPIHVAAFYGSMRALEFLMDNCPSGINCLYIENDEGTRPLDELSSGNKKKIFQHLEKLELESSLSMFPDESFVNLVFSLLYQNMSHV